MSNEVLLYRDRLRQMSHRKDLFNAAALLEELQLLEEIRDASDEERIEYHQAAQIAASTTRKCWQAIDQAVTRLGNINLRGER